MKLLYLVPALALAQLAVSRPQDKPNNKAYEKYCNENKSQGTISTNSTQIAYFCDSKAPVGKNSVNASSPTSCYVACKGNGTDCDTAVWDRNTGLCWIGRVSGERTPAEGYMVLSPDDHGGKNDTTDSNAHEGKNRTDGDDAQRSTCQGEQQRYKPVDPICDKNDRQVTEVKDQRFYLACSRRAPNLALQPNTYDSLADCMGRCTNVTGCRFVTYEPETKLCFSGDGDWFLSKPSADGNFHSAFKVGG
ncbi:hypothetical protein FE257_005410 [Aspergillus nanangensis]|uniref:Apple domain-containing protein n=1 Tax=Aspergillus nanangensis TaxID=2582783 RepID=A0AAD4CQH2_ASPNN|nr:hypothetical protein FE257_005410 [Aspergillus nanangensis]